MRMGADKAEALWLGVRAVDRVVAIAADCGAGPVGGVVAGARALRAAGCHRALILAVDAPTLRPEDLLVLIDAPEPGAAFNGLHLPMILTLAAMPDDAMASWPLARLVDRAGLHRLLCPDDSLARVRGANTPEERDGLLRSLRE